jgi:regulator of replication initiation timing
LKSADKEQFNAVVKKSKSSKIAINSLLKVNEHLRSELSETMTIWTIKLKRIKTNLQLTGSKLKNSQKKLTQLKQAGSHAKERHERSVMAAQEKALQEKSIHQLMLKGVFTKETRNVVRILVKAGCF